MSDVMLSILGTPGYIRNQSRFDDDNLLKVLGNNSGNLIFQYAVSSFIKNKKVHISPSENDYSELELVNKCSHLIFPAANHLRLGADLSNLNNYLEGIDKPLIVLGLGAQSASLNGELDLISNLKKDAEIMRFIRILRDKGVIVSVRGEYSRKVCAELGLHDVLVLGCPSVWLNPNPKLGEIIEHKLIRFNQNFSKNRLAVTAAAPFEIYEDQHKKNLERLLFDFLRQNEGIYVQQSGGVVSMQASNGKWSYIKDEAKKSIAKVIAPDIKFDDFVKCYTKKSRFYTDARNWKFDLELMELSIGTRLHGNMAAIAGGVPGIIIAHDSRTNELAKTMKLPQISSEDFLNSKNIKTAISKVKFCGKEFDAWRAKTAVELSTAFHKESIELDSSLTKIANS